MRHKHLYDYKILSLIKQNSFATVAEWQTRTFKGRVGDCTGSSPVCRTKNFRRGKMPFFFY